MEGVIGLSFAPTMTVQAVPNAYIEHQTSEINGF